jgi:hypothetical protein
MVSPRRVIRKAAHAGDNLKIQLKNQIMAFRLLPETAQDRGEFGQGP